MSRARPTPTSVTVAEAADILGVSRWSISRGMDRADIPSVRLTPTSRRRVPTAWLCKQLGVKTLPEGSIPQRHTGGKTT